VACARHPGDGREFDMAERRGLHRRRFCFCCLGGAASMAAGTWLTPDEVFAEARGLVSLIKDSAATTPITTYKLRNNISVLEGSGGNMAVLTGSDGKLLVDAGITVSRDHIGATLAAIGPEPITHLINTHWHFDHTDGNTWLNQAGAKIIAQRTRGNTSRRCSGWMTGTITSCRFRRAVCPTRYSIETMRCA
jgi:hypothetical protein